MEELKSNVLSVEAADAAKETDSQKQLKETADSEAERQKQLKETADAKRQEQADNNGCKLK